MISRRLIWFCLFLLPALACSLPQGRPPAAERLPTLMSTAAPPITSSSIDEPSIDEPPVEAPTATAPPASPTPSPWRLSAGPGVPAELVTAAQALATADPAQFTWVEGAQGDVRLVVGNGRPLAQWIYVVAAPFATVADSVTLTELQGAWQGEIPLPLLVAEETAALFTDRWGAPAASVLRSDSAELAALLWQQRPAWAILPFHRLTPDLKLLHLDQHVPGQRGLDSDGYPLAVVIGVEGEETAVGEFLASWSGPTTNRDEARLTRVAMTGVTALVRATAYQMELQGIDYPGQEVAPVLQGADIAHVSNEVSFSPDCPYPNPIGDTSFCSRDSYFDLLQTLGVDVVELTGNHLNDKGTANLLHSLDLYEAAGMAYFGGGRDLSDAQRPAIFEHNGNQIAFVGCNPVGPAYAWATELGPGALPCNDEALAAQIQQLRAGGHVVIATLQYWEHYAYAATAQQQIDFKALAAAGAAGVSGSQGHHAQGFAFHEGAFIHYGLGNLFFDQMDMLGTRQTFVDTYLVYDGRLLNVELWTGLIENYARPRLMTPAEREQFLRTVFTSSGW